MTRPVITFRPNTAIREAAAVLTERGITAAPVLDGADELVGMVSEADLIAGRFAHDPRSQLRRDEGIGDEPAGAPQTVGEVMTRTVIAMSANADAADLAQAMVDRDIRSVPIVTGSAVIGIVSRRDLLRTLVRDDDVVRADVVHRLETYTGGWTGTAAPLRRAPEREPGRRPTSWSCSRRVRSVPSGGHMAVGFRPSGLSSYMPPAPPSLPPRPPNRCSPRALPAGRGERPPLTARLLPEDDGTEGDPRLSSTAGSDSGVGPSRPGDFRPLPDQAARAARGGGPRAGGRLDPVRGGSEPACSGVPRAGAAD